MPCLAALAIAARRAKGL